MCIFFCIYSCVHPVVLLFNLTCTVQQTFAAILVDSMTEGIMQYSFSSPHRKVHAVGPCANHIQRANILQFQLTNN